MVLPSVWFLSMTTRAGGYPPHEGLHGCARPLAVITRTATSTNVLGLRALWRSYSEKTLLEGLAQDLGDMASDLRQLIQEEHAVVRQRHFAWRRHLAPPINPTSAIVWWRRRTGRVVAKV